jgi:hypothetical protein
MKRRPRWLWQLSCAVGSEWSWRWWAMQRCSGPSSPSWEEQYEAVGLDMLCCELLLAVIRCTGVSQSDAFVAGHTVWPADKRISFVSYVDEILFNKWNLLIAGMMIDSLVPYYILSLWGTNSVLIRIRWYSTFVPLTVEITSVQSASGYFRGWILRHTP